MQVVTRPFCLVKSRSQDAAANAAMLSVYLSTILYYHHQLFIDIERQNIPSLYFIVRSTCYDQIVIKCVGIQFCSLWR